MKHGQYQHSNRAPQKWNEWERYLEHWEEGEGGSIRNYKDTLESINFSTRCDGSQEGRAGPEDSRAVKAAGMTISVKTSFVSPVACRRRSAARAPIFSGSE